MKKKIKILFCILFLIAGVNAYAQYTGYKENLIFQNSPPRYTLEYIISKLMLLDIYLEDAKIVREKKIQVASIYGGEETGETNIVYYNKRGLPDSIVLNRSFSLRLAKEPQEVTRFYYNDFGLPYLIKYEMYYVKDADDDLSNGGNCCIGVMEDYFLFSYDSKNSLTISSLPNITPVFYYKINYSGFLKVNSIHAERDNKENSYSFIYDKKKSELKILPEQLVFEDDIKVKFRFEKNGLREFIAGEESRQILLNSEKRITHDKIIYNSKYFVTSFYSYNSEGLPENIIFKNNFGTTFNYKFSYKYYIN